MTNCFVCGSASVQRSQIVHYKSVLICYNCISDMAYIKARQIYEESMKEKEYGYGVC